MTPFSVTTCEIWPPSVSQPRAAQCWTMMAPFSRAARAIAGTAIAGSAQPSSGEWIAAFHFSADPGISAATSAAEKMPPGRL